MQFSVTFRHMEATEALKSYARERLEKIRKYFPDPISVSVVMSTERRFNHRVDVTLKLHNGLMVAGHETTEDMYSSIDLVAAKIERQVRRYKDKLRTHKGKSATTPVAWSHSVLSDQPGEFEEVQEDTEETQAESAGATVTKSEKFEAMPMSVDEAIMQLNLTHKQFLVFCDESGSINVVYRREDDTYGLIETAANPSSSSASA